MTCSVKLIWIKKYSSRGQCDWPDKMSEFGTIARGILLIDSFTLKACL